MILFDLIVLYCIGLNCIVLYWIELNYFLLDLMMASSTPIESSRIAPYINVTSSPTPRLPGPTGQERFGNLAVPTSLPSHYLPYIGSALGSNTDLLAAAHHYAAAAVAAHASSTASLHQHPFISIPIPHPYPFSLSAILASERLNTKNSSIADLR